MKKSLKLAAAMSVLAAPAMAANLENPLYMPTAGEFYSKTIQEDLGIGITDRIAIRGAFQYTHDGDINRKGMNHGRFGLIWRPIQTSDNIVLDIYADAHLGGINKMRGSYTSTGFQYDNYSNGRWGVDAGVRFGKTWSKLTTSAFVEVLKTFGSSNNFIDVSGLSVPIAGNLYPVSMAGVPDEISVDLKSTTEINFGVNAFYQINDRWSWGAGFKYNHHADNGVKGLATDINYNPLIEALAKPAINSLIAGLSDMNDGFDEYIVTLSVANQLTDYVQVALYGEYTFDTAHANSQNGTDV